jgi:hypothetical protein
VKVLEAAWKYKILRGVYPEALKNGILRYAQNNNQDKVIYGTLHKSFACFS